MSSDTAAPGAEASAPATIADLPSGEPIPTSSAPVPSKPARPLPIGALLAAAPSNVDAFLAHLNKCLATPSGIDVVLQFICYSSRLTAAGLTALSQSALRRSAREWIALVAALPPKTTIFFSTTVAGGTAAGLPSTAAATAALAFAARLRALGALISEARMIMRLWALVGMYFWGRGLVLKSLQARRQRQQQQQAAAAAAKGGEVVEKKAEASHGINASTAVAYVQFLSTLAFQVLENGAYLSSKGVLGWTPAQQARAFKWSTRFWAIYVGAELGRLAAEGFGPGAAARAQKQEEVDVWRSKVTRNLAWAPLTVSWSMEQPFLGDAVVSMLASIPSVMQMRELWASTA